MMLFEKGKIMLGMKFCSALFLIFMLYGGVKVIHKMDTEFEEIADLKNEYNTGVCSNYYMFHIFAFVLGAFWNVKKLLKVGII